MAGLPKISELPKMNPADVGILPPVDSRTPKDAKPDAKGLAADQGSLASLNIEKGKQAAKLSQEKKEDAGAIKTITEAVTSFFSYVVGWFWGSKTNDADLNQKSSSAAEGIANRPKLPRPNSESLNRYLEDNKSDHIKEIKESEADELKADIWKGRFTDAALLALIFALSKGQTKNRDEEGLLLTEKIRKEQMSLKNLRSEKNALDEKIGTIGWWIGLMGKAGIGFSVAIGAGVLATGASAAVAFFSGGALAAPAAFTAAAGITTALGTAAQAFNTLAQGLATAKRNNYAAEAHKKKFQKDETQLQIKMDMNDLVQSLKSIQTAQELLVKEAKKAAEMQSSINLNR